MPEVNLYELNTPKLKVSVKAIIQDDGNLVIDGFDIGETVEELMGDIDYEYILTVHSVHKPELLKLLNATDDAELLHQIQTQFNGNYVFSEFRLFLDQHQIPYETFFWR
jgi:hypothetical protein